MARKFITQDEVFSAARELVARGEQPTTLKVSHLLGRGSYSTITKYLKQWEDSAEAVEARADQLPKEAEVPDFILEDAQALAKKLWAGAKVKADEDLEVERSALSEVQAQYESEIEQAINSSDLAVAKREEAEELLETVEAERNELQAEIERLTLALAEFDTLQKNYEALTVDFQAQNKNVIELETRCQLSEAQLEKQAQQHETEITRLVKQHDRAFSVIEKLKK